MHVSSMEEKWKVLRNNLIEEKQALALELASIARMKSQIIKQKIQLTEEQQDLALQGAAVNQEIQGVAKPSVKYVQMITTKMGEMQQFNLNEKWCFWHEQFEQFLLLNEVPETKKASLLITLLGAKGYSTLRNLCQPHLPSTLSYGKLIDKMSRHFNPSSDVIRARYNCEQCCRKESDDIQTYVAVLKKLSLRVCQHLGTVRAVPFSGIRFPESFQQYDSSIENWICLECYTVLRSSSFIYHPLSHNETTAHPITLNLNDLSVWCYKCDSFIKDQRLIAARDAVYRSRCNRQVCSIHDASPDVDSGLGE